MMKVNLKIEVPDRQSITRSQKDISVNIQKIVNDRINSSQFARKDDRQICLFVFISKDKPNEKVKEISSGLYFGYDASMSDEDDFAVFMTILKNGLRSNLDIPNEEKNVIVYIANDYAEIDKIFSSEKEVTEQYVAKIPDNTLDDVVMTEKERRAVMRAITLIRDKELIYNKWNFRRVDKHQKSILCFHGVPGTGKTMCAHGVAFCLGKKIIEGSYAEIESEFVGVGAKNLVALFKAAQEQDAVLFIDEADTFLSRRLPASNDSSKHYNSMSNQLYTLIESFNGCIVFASNHIKDFDPAVISRIIEPIEFNLPDLNGRKSIWRRMLQNELPIKQEDKESTISILAEATEGFSGRDIRKAIQIAHAAIVWKYKYELNIPEDDICAEIEDILVCIREVKEANHKIQQKNTRKGNLLTSFADQDKRNMRIIQMAAHTLLADGRVDEKEKHLFKELESKLRVSCNLEKESLPSIKSICSDIDTNEEKLEIIDVVCRMSAIDGVAHDNELLLLKSVCEIFSLNEKIYESLVSYTNSLADDYTRWTAISESMGISDSEILTKLKTEYSEGASYYRLAQYYKNGSSLFGGIPVCPTKASKYETIARNLGYSISLTNE